MLFKFANAATEKQKNIYGCDANAAATRSGSAHGTSIATRPGFTALSTRKGSEPFIGRR